MGGTACEAVAVRCGGIRRADVGNVRRGHGAPLELRKAQLAEEVILDDLERAEAEGAEAGDGVAIEEGVDHRLGILGEAPWIHDLQQTIVQCRTRKHEGEERFECAHACSGEWCIWAVCVEV